MSAYGGFEPRRAHQLGAVSSVHEARPADGRGGRYALKILHPPPSTNIRRAFAIEAWLLAAERQQLAAMAGPALEVAAWGRCPEGAFAVFPWREASIEPLVESLRPKGDRLRALASRILASLGAWEAAYGGPHGKLKPSNIFLDGTGPLAGRSAVFSDPWAMPGARPEELRRHDLAAVADILIRVVRGRAAGGWPIEDGPEWRALGRPGTAWREYCNFLLSPPGLSEPPTLAEATRRLQRIPADPRPARTATRVVAGGVILATGGGLAFARFGSPDVMPERVLIVAEALGNPRAFRLEIAEEWTHLCRAWGTWVGDALRNGERWEATEGLWGEEDPLRRALARFRTQADALDPRVVVPEAAGNSLGVLADSPPDSVRQELLRGSVDRRVQFAWIRVKTLAAQMDAWSRWAELAGLADQLAQRGFPRVAATVRQRLPARSGDAPADTALAWRAFNQLSQDRYGLLVLLPRWQAIEALATELEASGDRVQRGLTRLALSTVEDSASIGEMAEKLAAPLAELRRRRAQFLAPDVARERFLREAPILSVAAPVTAADVAAWEEQLLLYSQIPDAVDPRAADDWEARFSRLQLAAAGLDADAPPADAGTRSLSRGDFDADLARLGSTLAAMREREILRLDLPSVTAEVERFRAAVAELERAVDATIALLRPAVWLQRMAETAWRFEAVDAQWKAWQQRALAGLTPAALEQDRALFRRIRGEAQGVREWLHDQEGAAGLGGLDVPALDSAAPATREALVAWADRRGNAAAAAILAAAGWSDARPVESWRAASDRAPVRSVLEAHRGWLAGLPGLAAELDRLGGLLAAGFEWHEGVNDVMAQLAGRDDLAGLAGAPATRLEDARRLAEVAGATDRATLVAATASDTLALKLAGWRRLGHVAGWPATVIELDTDVAVIEAIRERIQKTVTAVARRAALQEELARETLRRWNRAARHAARNEAELTATFERMERLGIAEADLEPEVRYNLRLWRLKHDDWRKYDLADLRRRRDEFVATVRATPELRADASIERLVQALEVLALRDDPSRPASRSPRQAGWDEQLAEGGQRVTVVWESGGDQVKLEYQLVQPADGTAPFYLARRDIAVGDFIALMNGHAEGGSLLEALPAWVRRDGDWSEPWTAPMAWRPRRDRRGVELNPTWIYRPDAQVAPLLAGETGEASPLGHFRRERPSRRSPLQRISPDAARLFAERVLGARLPTPQEWGALMAEPRPAAGANLRGQRFSELWSYLDGYRVASQTIAWRPNQGIFLPLQPAGEGVRTRRLPLRDAGAAYEDREDDYLWLAPVDEGPEVDGFIHLLGNVWIYLYDPRQQHYYVAGGSALSPPSLDPTEPQRVEGIPLIGSRRGRALVDGFSDVGVRPAFDAPPGLRDRLEMLRLVRVQQFLTL